MAMNKMKLPRQYRAASVTNANPSDDNNNGNVIEIVFTTGADVLRVDPFDGYYIERLETQAENVDLDRLNAGASFLDSHDDSRLSSIIGSVVPGSAEMTADGQGVCKILLSQSARAADTVADIKAGIIRNISVGYAVHAFNRVEPADGSPAIMTATFWQPLEVSAVAVPADPGAQIRTAARSLAGIEMTEVTITKLIEEATVAEKNKTEVKTDEKDLDKSKLEMSDDTEATRSVAVREDDSDERKNARAADDEESDDSDNDDENDSDDSEDEDEDDKKESKKNKRSIAAAVSRDRTKDRKRMAAILGIAKRFAVIPGIDTAAHEAIESGTSVADYRAEVLGSVLPQS